MKRTLSSLMLSLACSAPAGAVTLVNPSFEDLSDSYVNNPDADYMLNAAADGWSLLLNSPDWYWAEGPTGYWETPFGDHFASAAATGLTSAVSAYREGVSQTVTGLTIGDTYKITFSHANGLFYNPGTPGSYLGVGVEGGWEVLTDGVSHGLVASTNDNSTPAPEHTSAWQSSSVNFVATSTSHEIQFVAYKPDGPQDPTFQFLDNVSVALVPEPSSFAFALTVCCLATRRRR